MACPHLSHRRESDDRSFDEERAYCTVADRFVQPMRADICTERYGLDPVSDCEIYRANAGLVWDESPDGAAEKPAEPREDEGTEKSLGDSDERGTTDPDAEEE